MFSIFNIAIFFYAAVTTQKLILLFYFSVNFSKSNLVYFLCFLLGKGHLVFVAMTQMIQLCITRKMLVIKHVGSYLINVCKSSNAI